MQSDKKLWQVGLATGATILVVVVAISLALGYGAAPVSAAAASPSSVPVIDDSNLQAMTTTIGGANPLPTTRTIPHWFGQTLDPHNGVTYGYNMVGTDPNNCGTSCSVTIEADITPVIVNIGGLTFRGSDVLP